jgi:hypothetical protein
MKCPPVLFLVFNRADLAKRVFETIRKAQPERLFIAADGPRPDRPQEEELCRETRKVVEQVDWKCEVRRLYRDRNLGCKFAPASGIDWFFDHVEEGIILEDDCLPDASFYPYCGELLEKYRDDDRVVHIAATNTMEEEKWMGPEDYKFWYFGGAWAWASWRRAWKLFDIQMTGWPEFERQNKMAEVCSCPEELRFRTQVYSGVHAGLDGIWDAQWGFARIRNGGLSITPRSNLVRNIGFDGRATHTRDDEHPLSRLKTKPMTFPLSHPSRVESDYAFGKSAYDSLHSLKFDAPERRGRRNFFQRMARSIRKRTARFRAS